MASGYFIRIGDRTSCGGKVLEGDGLVIMFGIPHVREGDRVSCGVTAGTFPIVGGISFIQSNGRRVAGTLDSISSCPCRATLRASEGGACYTSENSALPGARSAPGATVPNPTKAPSTSPESPRPASASAFHGIQGEEPGFYIVPKSIRREELRAQLLVEPSRATVSKFYSLNPGSDLIKAGSIIVLSDPQNQRCTREEAMLMQKAAAANLALESLNAEEADFMMQHRDELATFMGYSSISVGVATAMYGRHLEEVTKLLKDIETLHQTAFIRDGHLRSAAFFAERKHLMGQLDLRLNSLTRKGVGIADHPNLKRALGISNRSLVHHWNQVAAPGQIHGYATHLEGVAKASKIIKAGGWVGVGLGGVASYNKVQAVCMAEDSTVCEQVRFTETSSFVGGVSAGLATGALLSTAAGKICVAIGAATWGVGGLACGLVVVGTGSYVAGKSGEGIGGFVGDLIFKALK